MLVLVKDIKCKEVGLWQKFLNSQGSTLKVDDDFGPSTVKATIAFQKKCGISMDGKVGPSTLARAMKAGFGGFNIVAPLIATKPVAPLPDSQLAMFNASSGVDKINAARLAHVAPALQERGLKFIAAAAADGVILQIVQGLRTFAEQDALYAQGRTKPGKRVTNAKGGQSFHNYGLALDLAPIVNGSVSWNDKLYAPYRKWAAAADLRWGGDWKKFKDMPHVEYLKGHSLAQIQGLYKDGGLARVWATIN
jgi:hypothetical protein